MRPLQFLAFTLILITACSSFAQDAAPDSLITNSEPTKSKKKVCIAHRGASAYAPEHTAAAYKLAMEMGTDFVEQDLAMSKDGGLVCIHDITLECTTNVAQIYPKRFSTAVGGENKKSWRVADFTLAELKKLDAGAWKDPSFEGERILTFQEAIDIVKTRPGIGIYPELKDADYHHGLGLQIEDAVLKVLADNGLDKPENQDKMPVFIQSFEPETLKYVRKKMGKTYKLVQLVSLPQASGLMTETGMQLVAQYADGLGPAIPLLTGDPRKIEYAHKAGLVLHPYTVSEKSLMKPFPDVKTWTHHLLFELKFDGVFTDNPDEFPHE